MTKMSREEKVAVTLLDLLSDFRLNLDLIGMYIAKFATRGQWLRLEEIFRSAESDKESEGSLDAHYQKLNDLSR